MIDGSERLRTNNFGIAVTSPAPQVVPSRCQLAQRIAGADAKSGWFRQHGGARHASAAAAVGIHQQVVEQMAPSGPVPQMVVRIDNRQF